MAIRKADLCLSWYFLLLILCLVSAQHPHLLAKDVASLSGSHTAASSSRALSRSFSRTAVQSTLSATQPRAIGQSSSSIVSSTLSTTQTTVASSLQGSSTSLSTVFGSSSTGISGGSSTSVSATSTLPVGVILPTASTALNKAQLVTAAIAQYAQSPTAANAQSAKSKIDDAIAAVALLTGPSFGPFASFFSALESALQPASQAAIAAVAGPSAASAASLAALVGPISSALTDAQNKVKSSTPTDNPNTGNPTTENPTTTMHSTSQTSSTTSSSTTSNGSVNTDTAFFDAFTDQQPQLDSSFILGKLARFTGNGQASSSAARPSSTFTSPKSSSTLSSSTSPSTPSTLPGLSSVQPSTSSTSPTPIPTGNSGGTNIRINSGCSSVNGSPRCAGGAPYNVAYQGQLRSTATIYASFNGQDTTDQNVTPGCQLDASWPYTYGDIYFGADGCLYDGSSNKIDNQCCTQSTSTQVSNPYYKPPPSGFYIEALKCDHNCADALEVVPYTKNTCTDIATNQVPFWGAAFPPNAPDLITEHQLPPFSLLDQMSNNPEVTIYYVFGTDFESTPCGIQHLNITLSVSSSGYKWSNTDNHSGTCQDTRSTSSSTCTVNSEDYTAQALLYCVDSQYPNYCSVIGQTLLGSRRVVLIAHLKQINVHNMLESTS